MTELLQLLTPRMDHKDDPAYAEADIRKHATKVVELIPGSTGRGAPGGLLAVHVEDTCVSFVVFYFMTSDIDGGNAEYGRVFHGYGFSGALRELRHSYWGEPENQGYIFYPSARLIAEAFEALNEWFDCE